MNAPVSAFRFRPDTESCRNELAERGYVVLRRAVDPALIARIDAASRPVFERTPFSRGAFYGSRTRRFLGLLNHLPEIAALVQHRQVLDICARHLTECDTIQLNSTQAIEVHPGAVEQPPHRDQIIWHEGANEFDFVVSVSWPFNHYDASVGATRVWPGSHRRENGGYAAGEPPVDVEMAPGDVMLFSGRVLHGQGTNSSDRVRRGVILSYSLGWLKQFENMPLTYPPSVARRFPPDLAALIGYRMQRPNLGSVGGACPSSLLGEEVAELPGLEDVMRPELAARISSYHATRQAASLQ